MEVLFHFIFELFKIALLASVYSTLIIWIASRIVKNKPENKLQLLITKRKKLLWWLTGFVISTGLFVYMRSYWGDHGLGDYARVPVGYGKAVEQIDGSWVSIRPVGFESEVLSIDEYAIADRFLIAKPYHANPNADNSQMAIWNLETNAVNFVSPNGLDSFKAKQHMIAPLEFRDFSDHYHAYWHRWRFWLFP